jgi:hypothetical protein
MGGGREAGEKIFNDLHSAEKRSRIRFPIELGKYLSNTIVKCLSTYFLSTLMGGGGLGGQTVVRNAEKMWHSDWMAE